MKFSWGVLAFALVLFTSVAAMAAEGRGAQAQHDQTFQTEAIWREAVALYANETGDYIDSISETLSDLKMWRQKVLRDRFEEKIRRLEVVLSKSNSEALSELEKYVTANGIDSLDDSLMMRLAQLHYDRANFDLTEQMKKYEVAVSQFQAGRIKALPAVPTPDYKKTVVYTAQLLHKFPNSPLSDRAHYLLAYCLSDEGKSSQSAKIYERLLRYHPYSELAAESRWRLAEYYFDAGQYDDALKHYRVLAASDSPFALKAAYKEGATLFAQGKFSDAALVFEHLYKVTGERVGFDPVAATIHDEAVDYLAHLKSKKVPLNIDEEADAIVTEQLAQDYRRINDRESARHTYLTFVAARSLSKASPRFMNAVIESYTDEDELAKAQSIRNRFVQALGADSPFWIKYKADVSTTVETQDLYETHILASAEFYAEQARNTKRPADYDAAVRFYAKFVTEYPWSPLRTQAQFEMAELEYFAGRYQAASSAYLSVTGADDNAEYRDEAAYGYLLSEAKRLRFPLQETSAAQPQRDGQGSLTPPSPLDTNEREFMKAAQVFVTLVPRGGRRQAVLYRVAEIFFKHNQFDKTRQSLEILLKDKEISALSTNAVRLIALTYDIENNWQKVIESNRRLLSAAPSADARGADLDSAVHAGSSGLIEARRLETSGQNAEAAAKYENYSIYFSNAQDTAFALFHAGVLYRESAQITASNRMFGRLMKEFGDSKYIPQAEFFKAANEESLLKFEEAATKYESFSKKYPTHFLSAQAYLNAATFRKAMHQYERAADNFREYNRRVPDDEVALQTAELYRMAKKSEKAVEIYNRYTTGQHGKDLFVRALFERASVLAEAGGVKNAAKIRFDCKTVDAAEKKFGKLLSASSLQAVVGCAYISTLAARDQLLGEKVWRPDSATAEIDALFKRYSEIQNSKNEDWISRSMADAGKITDHFAELTKTDPEKSNGYEKKALAFYKKVYESREKTAAREIPEFVIEALRRRAPEVVALNDEYTFWPMTIRDARVISVRWPSESSPLKLWFDQEKWPELEKASEKQLEEDPSAYVFEAKARSFAEQGFWSRAQDTLVACIDKTKDDTCAAGLLGIGYSGPKENDYKEILEKGLKSESRADYNVALAQLAARQGRPRDAFKFAQEAVENDPKYAPAYTVTSNLFLESQRPELARITLDEGLKNTDKDDRLVLQKGHLADTLRIFSQGDVIADEFSDQTDNSGVVNVFLARNLVLQGKEKEGMAFVTNLPASDPDRADVLLGQFYFAMMKHDMKAADDLLPMMRESSKESAPASYLVGLYLQYFKGDKESGKTYLGRARQQGVWGKSFERITAAAEPVRSPTSKEGTP